MYGQKSVIDSRNLTGFDFFAQYSAVDYANPIKNRFHDIENHRRTWFCQFRLGKMSLYSLMSAFVFLLSDNFIRKNNALVKDLDQRSDYPLCKCGYSPVCDLCAHISRTEDDRKNTLHVNVLCVVITSGAIS